MQEQAPQILFEDKYLLAINKPNGVVVEGNTASVEFLALQYLRAKEKYPDKCFVAAAHRLDSAVSGVLLLAKKKSTLKALMELFERREAKKTYLSVVQGNVQQSSATLKNWLVKDDAQRKAVIYDAEVKYSSPVELRYKTLQQLSNQSLLEVELITGKYHQIRAQLAHTGHSVLNDIKYGAKKLSDENMIALHAWLLEFKHPVSAELITVKAPPPANPWWKDWSTIR